MARTGFTISDLNRLNQEFWDGERILMERRMADEAVLDTALESLRSESERGMPLCFQKSFEATLAQAERSKQRFMSQQGRMGGKVKKTDALQQLIVDIARGRPNITTPQLLDHLRDCCPIPPIEGIDDEAIYFTAHDGRAAEAKISGLKDRLWRAKKTRQSR